MEPRRAPSPEPDHAALLNPKFPAPRILRNKFLLYISHRVCGTLLQQQLQQCKWTKTTSLIVGEVHRKTRSRYHYTTNRMPKIKKIPNGDVEQLAFSCCWQKCKLVQTPGKQIGGFLSN